MKFIQNMLTSVITKIWGSPVIEINGQQIDFSGEWEIVTFRELLLRDCGIDIDKYSTAGKLLQEITAKKIDLSSAADPHTLGRGNFN